MCDNPEVLAVVTQKQVYSRYFYYIGTDKHTIFFRNSINQDIKVCRAESENMAIKIMVALNDFGLSPTGRNITYNPGFSFGGSMKTIIALIVGVGVLLFGESLSFVTNKKTKPSGLVRTPKNDEE